MYEIFMKIVSEHWCYKMVFQQKAKKEAERRLKEKEEPEKGDKEKTYNWRKSHKGRYFYRDAADVIQEGKPTMHTISR